MFVCMFVCVSVYHTHIYREKESEREDALEACVSETVFGLRDLAHDLARVVCCLG
jgi:hypothetical protein